MKRKVFFIFTSVAVMIGGLVLFYYFTTHDANYQWSKEFVENVRSMVEKRGFRTETVKEINPDDIKLPAARVMQLKLQELGSKVGLTRYGEEFGQSVAAVSDDKRITFKAWCLGDHIKGLEIEYNNLDASQLDSLKRDVRIYFDHCAISWTQR